MADRSGCEIVKVDFKWEIQVPFLQTTDGSGEPIVSCLFSSPETPNSQWKMMMFDLESKFSIYTVHYHSKGINEVDPDLMNLSIQDKNRERFHHQFMPTQPLGYQIRKSECLDCIQSNGNISIFCMILALVKKEHISPGNAPGIAINCSDGLSTQFEGLLSGMQFSDVVFNIAEREFSAHKLILATRSNVFAAMFEHPTKEKLTNHINIEDVDPEVFQELLRFLYTGRLSTTTMETKATDLLVVADKYLLDELKTECENYLLSHMSSVKCVELLLNANLLDSMKHLKKETIKFFRRFSDQVMATDQWETLKHENPALLYDIEEIIYNFNL